MTRLALTSLACLALSAFAAPALAQDVTVTLRGVEARGGEVKAVLNTSATFMRGADYTATASGDKAGNLVFRKTARNFNPNAAMAGKITIVEVEHLVEIGEIDPDAVHLPSIFVHRIVVNATPEKRIEQRTVRAN